MDRKQWLEIRAGGQFTQELAYDYYVGNLKLGEDPVEWPEFKRNTDRYLNGVTEAKFQDFFDRKYAVMRVIGLEGEVLRWA